MKKLSYLLLLFTAFVFSSCAGPYTIDDSGRSINISNYDEFQVELVGNASTGNQWVVWSIDTTVIKQIGDPSYKSVNDKIGSAGLYTFTFKSVADGSSKLVLVYKRKWEDIKPEDKVFEMEVVVGTMGRILEE